MPSHHQGVFKDRGLLAGILWVPEIIVVQSDNGREFKGAVAMLCKRLKIKVINGRPRHPQTQGLVEQANSVAKKKINAWIHDAG